MHLPWSYFVITTEQVVIKSDSETDVNQCLAHPSMKFAGDKNSD